MQSQFLSLRSSLYTTSRWNRCLFRLDATVSLENKVLPRPMGNEVSFSSSSLCSVLFFPGLFPSNLLKPFFITLWWWFHKFWECSFTARTSSLAHTRSLDHYVSFFLAPATTKGPLLVMLTFRQKSMDLGSRGLFYFKHLTIYTWVPFCIGLKRPFRPCFGKGNLYSFLRVPVGLCYAHLPFQKHLLSEP